MALDDTRLRIGFVVRLDEPGIDRMARALSGLPVGRAERLVRRQAADDGVLDAHDLARVRAARASLFADDGVLELVEPDGPALSELAGIGVDTWGVDSALIGADGNSAGALSSSCS